MHNRIQLDAGQAPRVPIWVLTLIVFSGTLAMHIFVPALPLARPTSAPRPQPSS